MPRVTETKGSQTPAQATPYGVNMNDNTKSFRERLMERFTATQFVRVKNIDTEKFVWQYLPNESEEVEFTPDPMKITRRKLPELWELEAGAEDVILGANAYLMIEGLYKKLAAKKALAGDEEKPGIARNFNYSDADAQEKAISQIFLGIETPSFGRPVTTPAETVEPPARKEVTGVSK